MNNLIKYLKHPLLIFFGIIGKIFGCNWMNDKLYLQKQFYMIHNKKINFDNPKTFNEKIQWLKLNDRKDIYTTMVDKYEVKNYVKNIIGNEYIIPTIDIYDDFDSINFDSLPNQFVIKCTHDSGSIIICKDKSDFDYKNAKRIIEKHLNHNYYYNSREWPYKNVKPRIIIEKYIKDNFSKELNDYKIFCFNGEPKLIQVDYDRFCDHKRRIYNEKWEQLNFCYNYNDDQNKIINKPKKLEKMLELSKKLSKNVPFLRCDFYVISDKIYFGELTLYPESGLGKFKPEMWDTKLGDMLDLNNYIN